MMILFAESGALYVGVLCMLCRVCWHWRHSVTVCMLSV